MKSQGSESIVVHGREIQCWFYRDKLTIWKAETRLFKPTFRGSGYWTGTGGRIQWSRFVEGTGSTLEEAVENLRTELEQIVLPVSQHEHQLQTNLGIEQQAV